MNLVKMMVLVFAIRLTYCIMLGGMCVQSAIRELVYIILYII